MQEPEASIDTLFSSGVAYLSATKKKQIIRLINPHEDKIEFGFKTDPQDPAAQCLTINPRSGSIPPRDYVLVRIETKDSRQLSKGSKLSLIYWKNDADRRRGYVKGLVPIRFDSEKATNNDDNIKSTRRGKLLEFLENNAFITLMPMLLRPTFLIALIIYNIILIKINIHSL